MIDPFRDYDLAYSDFRWDVPQYLNIAEQVCERWCEHSPETIAVIDATDLGNIKRHSYADLNRAANTLAHHLARLGVGAGDRVGVLRSQDLWTAAAHIAIWKLGAISIPLFKLFGPYALSSRLLDAGATCVIVDEEGHAGLSALDVVQVLPERLAVSDQSFECANTCAETPAVLIYTSGTTGKSKGALHAHRVLMGHLPGVEVSHDFLGQNGDVIWTPADWAGIGGVFDVLIGINLLREGLDIPECALVGILDADKEGFLRSKTSLVQTIGRAARNAQGRVIMYADRITGSMERALAETDRRREKQVAYNTTHGITPQTIKKNVEDILSGLYKGDTDQSRVTAQIDSPLAGGNLQTVLEGLRNDMRKAAENLEFEEAARLRDEVKRLEAVDLAIADDPLARQSAVEAAGEAAVKSRGRSKAGRGGTRTYRGQAQRKA